MISAESPSVDLLPPTQDADYGAGRSFYRRILEFPDWQALAEHTRLRMIRLDNRLCDMRAVATIPPPSEHSMTLDTKVREKLAHPLSWCFFEQAPQMDWAKRTAIEHSSLNRVHASLWYFAHAGKGEEFRCALGDLCTLGLGVKSCYRTTQGVGTTEARGGRVIFPCAALASARLNEIKDMLSRQPRAYPSWIFFATVMMVCISNAHPFTNGNGRVSRMIFNSVLRTGGMPDDAYVPLYEVNQLARGGFELRVREAELGRGWDKLAHYICDVIEIAGDYERSV